MFIFYILLIAYIAAVNFYAFMLVKTLRDKELEDAKHHVSAPAVPASNNNSSFALPEKPTGRLYLTGLLGGAVTIYVCMFLLK